MSLPRVFDVVVFVAFWLGSRHSEVQGEFEETCSERIVSVRKRAAKREVMSLEAMMSVGSGQWSGSAFLETPFGVS
jgi:hypothetical protein